MKKYFICVILLLFLLYCKFFRNEKDRYIARVYNKYLYSSDLEDIIPKVVSKADSAEIAQRYIQNWIKQTLIINKAEQKLPPEKMDFEKQITDYRNSLIIYEYEKEYVRKNLDTIIKPQEIKEYYEKNKENFLLKENIVKAYFIKVRNNAPEISNLWWWYKSDKREIQDKLKEYCVKYCEKYSLDNEKWIFFNDIIQEMPLRIDNKKQYLQYNRYIEVRDTSYLYLVRIFDYKTTDSISPLSLVEQDIKNIILNKRRLDLIERMEDALYKEAMNNRAIEVY